MHADLVISGGTIVTADRIFVGDVVVRDGRIAAVSEADVSGEVSAGAALGGGTGGPGDGVSGRVIDASGMYVLPGLVDVHVHFRDPGMTRKEDFATGTAAAALGGVTTVLDMPNTSPPVSSSARFQDKTAAVAGRAYVDYGLYGVINEHNLGELAGMAEAGAAAFKLFLGPTTGDIRAPGRGRLMEVFEIVRDLGLPLVVHAEDRDVIEYWERRIAERAGEEHGEPRALDCDYAAFLASRPRFGEAAATQTVCLLAAMTDTPVHIAHVSIAEAVAVIRQAKAAGAPVSAETCPPYLTMTAADCRRLGPLSKILPPIRHSADQDALWRGLHDGVIDIIATDHAPHEPAVKDGPSWMEAAGGMIGVQTMLLQLLGEVHRGRMSLHDLVRWTSRGPAQRFGLADRKGDVRVGLDADLVIVDPRRATTVTAEFLQSRSKNSPLMGTTLRGAVVHTILRGHVVVRDGRLTGPPVGRRL